MRSKLPTATITLDGDSVDYVLTPNCPNPNLGRLIVNSIAEALHKQVEWTFEGVQGDAFTGAVSKAGTATLK